jgi:hypothetical protein
MGGTGRAGRNVVGGDAADHPVRTPGPGIDRRTIIKRAAAGGVLAWTAPVILDSLASPAGAITCTSPCFRVQFPPSNGSCLQLTSQTVATLCTPTSTECPTTTNLGPGVAIGDVCILPNNCAPNSPFPAFQLNNTGTTCFDDDGATCPPPRRFLAAQARYAPVSGDQGCVAAAIQPTPGTDFAGFPAPANFDRWLFFQFLIGCTCS